MSKDATLITELSATSHGHRRWLALLVLCLSVLMIVLDSTVMNVALPSIQRDLAATDRTLVWIVNAYLLTFGGTLLLGGRLGDAFGRRRVFTIGIAVFTCASLACALASQAGVLVLARGVQGLGGAVVMAVALSLIAALFPEPGERARAMGVYGFVCAGGGSVGVLLGGGVTHVLSWHWVFLINVPVGFLCFGLARSLLSDERPSERARRINGWSGVAVTIALMCALYGVANGIDAGWAAGHVLTSLAAAMCMFAVFWAAESRANHPLVPFALVRERNLAVSAVVRILWSAAAAAWSFSGALYLQLVLGLSPLKTGIAFLPANLLMGAFALGLSARIVMRFGIRVPVLTGLMLVAAGLGWLARVPVDGDVLTDVLPAMASVGVGSGIASNPLLLAGVSRVPEKHLGVASGLLNTASILGGAFGLAVLAGLSYTSTADLLAEGRSHTEALVGGYRVSFGLGSFCALAAAVIGAGFLRTSHPTEAALGTEVPGRPQ